MKSKVKKLKVGSTTCRGYDHKKYIPFQPIDMPQRRWPDSVIKKSPVWCSVDLRDGNQALVEPMTVEEKMQLFKLLVAVGFKQIEVGFPSASQPDYDFVRVLIEKNLIPDDVTIQVLTQAREHLIERTFEALRGVKRAIVHVYNSTSRVQREQVFQLDKASIINIAVNGARWVHAYAMKHPETDWTFQYSPESFTGTELDFAVDVCNAVIDVWQPIPTNPVIINLPATVEMATPNIFADQVEWFLNHVQQRDCIELSVHTHNDRGCAVAAAELAVMAGAKRVEGTLLGNGERTGNMDVVTMAMNLYSQGIDPQLDLSRMDEIIACVEQCTKLPVHPRHPYAGELVYSAFSGSHQDAIKKCMDRYEEGSKWEVAYLPIDPRDLGRTYQEVIRINSQSGKGGIAHILEREYGLRLPRWLQIEFSKAVQKLAETVNRELDSTEIWREFERHYLLSDLQLSKYSYLLQSYRIERCKTKTGHDKDVLWAELKCSNGDSIQLNGVGKGAIHALTSALKQQLGIDIEILAYSEHGLNVGADAKAVTYIQIIRGQQRFSGVAISEDTVAANINAVLSAVAASVDVTTEAATALSHH